jgi:hypothetical protein
MGLRRSVKIWNDFFKLLLNTYCPHSLC